MLADAYKIASDINQGKHVFENKILHLLVGKLDFLLQEAMKKKKAFKITVPEMKEAIDNIKTIHNTCKSMQSEHLEMLKLKKEIDKSNIKVKQFEDSAVHSLTQK